MHSTYSIDFHVLSDNSDTSHGAYPKEAFMALLVVYPNPRVATIKTVAINQYITVSV